MLTLYVVIFVNIVYILLVLLLVTLASEVLLKFSGQKHAIHVVITSVRENVCNNSKICKSHILRILKNLKTL